MMAWEGCYKGGESFTRFTSYLLLRRNRPLTSVNSCLSHFTMFACIAFVLSALAVAVSAQ